MRMLVVAFSLIVLSALPSCQRQQQGEYWVSGLTLPKGSTAIDKSEVTDAGQIAQSVSDPALVPNIDKMLLVGFNCPTGWEAVCSHIDSCMLGQGYRDATGESPTIQKLQKASGQDARIKAVISSSREYAKDGAKFRVVIFDPSLGGMTSVNQSTPKFQLTVYHLK